MTGPQGRSEPQQAKSNIFLSSKNILFFSVSLSLLKIERNMSHVTPTRSPLAMTPNPRVSKYSDSADERSITLVSLLTLPTHRQTPLSYEHAWALAVFTRTEPPMAYFPIRTPRSPPLRTGRGCSLHPHVGSRADGLEPAFCLLINDRRLAP